MNNQHVLASAAALVAEPARAAMLLSPLVLGEAPASALARAANVSAQSASMHLTQLLNGRFVQAARQGRYRYYRIASPEIAHAIEALGAITNHRRSKLHARDDEVRDART